MFFLITFYSSLLGTCPLARKGYSGIVFPVIDLSTIITKSKLWEERDRAIANGKRNLIMKSYQNMQKIKMLAGVLKVK